MLVGTSWGLINLQTYTASGSDPIHNCIPKEYVPNDKVLPVASRSVA